MAIDRKIPILAVIGLIGAVTFALDELHTMGARGALPATVLQPWGI